MNRLSPLFHRAMIFIQFHAEKLNLISRKYPRKILQTQLDKNGIWFEVTNITEANRVLYLDDEGEFIRQLLQEINEDDVFFDIGACIGIYCLHAAKITHKIYAFEPDPGFRDHLIENMKINNMNYINLFPYAIADESGKLLLFTDGVNGRSPSLDNNDFKGKVEVDALSIDSMVTQSGIPSPSIIKMDIEGAEFLALKGMKEILKSAPPRLIFIEIHPSLLPHFGSSKDEVISMLYESGYKIKYQMQRDAQFHYIFQNSTHI